MLEKTCITMCFDTSEKIIPLCFADPAHLIKLMLEFPILHTSDSLKIPVSDITFEWSNLN